jgi:hypothetical protein
MAMLSEQIALLDEQLQLSQQANNAMHILEEYELIRRPLSKNYDSLKTMLDRFIVLQNLPEDAPLEIGFSEGVQEAVKSAFFALQAFTARWQSEGHESRQGNDLGIATKSLSGLISSGATEVDQCWKSWRESLERLVALEDILLESQRNIPGLEEIHKAFVKNRQEFRALVARFPTDVSDIEKLKQLSDTLQQLKVKMQFDLPDEVATFFKQLDSLSRRVSLSTMTPEVFEWLRSHKLLDAYVVSRKGTIHGY